jgi:hypothetical protein
MDLAEGVRPEAGTPHLGECARCRRQVDELRATISMTAAVDVPDPSPLFWDHLSARVRDAIEREPPVVASGWQSPWVWRAAAPLAVGVAVLLAVATTLDRGESGRVPAGGEAATASAPASVEQAETGLVPASDASFGLIADLAADLDWSAALEAGLTTRPQALGELATALDADERAALRKLLEEELMRPGA